MTPRHRLPVIAGGILCLGFAASLLADQIDRQTAGATIVGTVVDSATGEPIQGVRITRIELAGTGRQVETISDDRGRFAFTGVPGGRWRVVGELSGYESGANDRRRRNGPDRPVDASSTSFTTVIIRMFRSFGSLCGVLVNDVNQASAGVSVNAAVLFGSATDSRTFAMASAAAITDDLGRFCLRLSPGSYAVVVPPVTVTTLRTMQTANPVGASGSVQSAIQRPPAPSLRIDDFDVFLANQNRAGLLPPTTSSARLDSVYDLAVHPSQTTAMMHTVVGGQVTSIGEISLRRVAAHTVSGTVFGLLGPVRDASVRIVPRLFSTSVEGTLDIATTRTDATGAFTMFGVPAGEYVVRATGSSAETGLAETPLVVGNSDVQGVVVRTQPGVRAKGHVVSKGQGPLTPELLRRVFISLVPVDSQIRGAAPSQPLNDGTFQTGDYPPGRYLLSVTPPPGWVLESAMHEQQDIALRPITLLPDATIDTIIALTDRPATLTGHVRNATGAADPNATVLLFPLEYHFRYGNGSPAQLFREARVTPDGSFEFRTVAPAEYFVIAIDDASADGWRTAAMVPRLAAVAQRIRLQAGSQLATDLRTQIIRRLP